MSAGCGVLGYGVSQELLVLVGETKSATVAEVERKTRQEKSITGSNTGRTERYYLVKYGFTAADGSIHSGSYEHPEGDRLPPGVGSSVQIRYLRFLPSVSGGADVLSTSLTGLLMTGLGAAMLLGAVKG